MKPRNPGLSHLCSYSHTENRLSIPFIAFTTLSSYNGTTIPEEQPELPGSGSCIKSSGGWLIGNHVKGTREQQIEIDELVHSKEESFSRGLHNLPGYIAEGYPGPFMVAPHNGEMPALTNIGQAPRKQSEAQKEACMAKLTPLKEAGIIVRAVDTSMVTNLVVVPKKSGLIAGWQVITERSMRTLPLIVLLFRFRRSSFSG